MNRLEPTKALAAARDLSNRAQFDALVGQMPGDPDTICSLVAGYDLQIEDVVRC